METLTFSKDAECNCVHLLNMRNTTVHVHQMFTKQVKGYSVFLLKNGHFDTDFWAKCHSVTFTHHSILADPCL